MTKNKRYLFDNPSNIKTVLRLLYGCCGVLLLLDFVIHRHVAHPAEQLWAFYPLYGFIGCVVLVLVAKWMRTFLMRSEDYYENNYPGNRKDSGDKSDGDGDGGRRSTADD